MQLGKLGKVVAAGTIAAMFAGSTVAFAQLQNYPSPFVQDGSANSLIVVGAAAAPSDVVGAVDLAIRLGGEATTDVSVSGTITGLSVSGEGRSISTTNEKIYLSDNFRKTGLRTALSDSDLPTLLKSGVVTDSDAGTTYDFDQFIDFPTGINLTFQRLTGKTPNFDVPGYIFDLDTSASLTNSFYRTRVVFNDEVNMTSVVGEKINLFGAEYTFSSETTGGSSPKVVLFGSSDIRTMQEGDEVTAIIDGTTHTVKLLTVGSATNIGVQVDSDSKSINKGSTATVGGVDIFVDDVFFTSKEGTVSSAKIFIGARKLILTNGTNVKTKVGSDSERTVDGTFVVITSSGSGTAAKLTGIDAYINAPTSQTDFLTEGGTFSDTVWKSFKLAFPGVTSKTTDAARDKIEILPSGTKDVGITFKTDRGDTNTVKFAHLDGSTLQLGDQDNDTIVVVENGTVQRNKYFVLDNGDFSRMFELTSVSSIGASDGQLTIRDVFSGNSIDVVTGSNNRTSKVIDGQTYYFQLGDAPTTDNPGLHITWGDAATFNTTGNYITVFPTLKTKNNARLAFTKNQSVSALPPSNGTAIQLPTGAFNLTWAGSTLTLAPVTTERLDASVLINASTLGSVSSVTIDGNSSANIGLGKTTGGFRWYRIQNNGLSGGLGTIWITPVKGTTATVGAVSSTPGVLLVEEQDDNSDLNSVLVDIGTETTSGDTRTIANGPDFSSRRQGTGTLTVDSNTDVSHNIDVWGTFSTRDISDQDKVRLFYPDDQVSSDVFVLVNDATVSSSGSVSGGTVKQAVPIKTPIAKLDTEVTSSDKSTKNLILVGGPAVNTLVAELAAAGKTRTLDFYRTQGAGYALVDYVASAFASGKAALVVAGHSADDTRVATRQLQAFDTANLKGARVEWKNGVIATLPA